jgi:hypothetical protein
MQTIHYSIETAVPDIEGLGVPRPETIYHIEGTANHNRPAFFSQTSTE